MTDAELYRRGTATMLAAWEEYARGSRGAAVLRSPGVAAAVFPSDPERAVYNNAVPERALARPDRAAALDRIEAAYASAGIGRYAVWVHESDEALRADVQARGFTLDETTRAMGLHLDDVRVPRPHVDLGRPDWSAHLRLIGVRPDLLAHADHAAFHVLVARVEGDDSATALAFDLGGDCGIYNMTTVERARRRGVGTAVIATHLHDAAARGCETATLQATAMAEGVYAAVGFRDLGRILEYVPPA